MSYLSLACLDDRQTCQAGKDVYVEKPISVTVEEGRKMVQAARKHERVVQAGAQPRMNTNIHE